MKRTTLLEAARAAFPGLTKDEAYAAIVCGEIYVNGERSRDPKLPVLPSSPVERRRVPFVSRGGLKLEHALSAWSIDVRGKVVLDAGSSTGGFTDCLLSRGAAAVHAVDVGTNQLAYRLRTDPRVLVHEQTNIMHLSELSPEPDAAVADLSFRSLRGAAAHILTLTREQWGVVLLKPQFELQGGDADFHGVVEDDKLLLELVSETLSMLRDEGAFPVRIVASPITGRRGNREFLVLIRADGASEFAGALEQARGLIYP